MEQANREYIYDIMTGSKKVRFLCYYILGNPHERSVHYSRSSDQRTNCSRDNQRSKEIKKHVEIKLYLPKLRKGKQPDRNFVWNIGKWLKRAYSKL